MGFFACLCPMFLGSHSAKEIIVTWSKHLLLSIPIPLKNHSEVCRRNRVWKSLLVMATILEEQFQASIRQLLREQSLCLHCHINLTLVPGWSFSEFYKSQVQLQHHPKRTGTAPGSFSSLVSDALTMRDSSKMSSDWRLRQTVEARACLLQASSIVKLEV